jgi:hypothetical protein
MPSNMQTIANVFIKAIRSSSEGGDMVTVSELTEAAGMAALLGPGRRIDEEELKLLLNLARQAADKGLLNPQAQGVFNAISSPDF